MDFIRRTDLASELTSIPCQGLRERKETHGAFTLSTVEIITEEAAKRFSKPRGKYITLDVGKLWLASDRDVDAAVALLAEQLQKLSCEVCHASPHRVLIVGLGNRKIVSDALGSAVVEQIVATRHLKKQNPALFNLLGGCELSAIAPGVLGQSGIETAEQLLGICEQVKPTLIVAIDSLCARSVERLATTVQIGSSGISPGSGVGNHRRPLNQETLGVPVLALGVATVIDSATLMLDALEEAGISIPHDALQNTLASRRGYLVTPQESDVMVRELAHLLAAALNAAFGSRA